jgi:hypothetical protein
VYKEAGEQRDLVEVDNAAVVKWQTRQLEGLVGDNPVKVRLLSAAPREFDNQVVSPGKQTAIVVGEWVR